MKINVKLMAMSFIGFVIRGVILIFLIMSIYRAGQKAYEFGFRIFTEEPMSPPPGRDVAITVSNGDSTMDVAESLEEKGLIRDAKLFYIQKKCSEFDGDIKPGFYTLNTSMTADDMFALIAGTKDDDEAEDETQDAPLTPASSAPSEAMPLLEQTGDGDWEGAEDSGEAEEENASEDSGGEINISIDANNNTEQE